MEKSRTLRNLEFNLQDLPIIIKVQIGSVFKEYILRTNKDKTSIFLNKKEY
jgi:hypothetical protein